MIPILGALLAGTPTMPAPTFDGITIDGFSFKVNWINTAPTAYTRLYYTGPGVPTKTVAETAGPGVETSATNFVHGKGTYNFWIEHYKGSRIGTQAGPMIVVT